MTIGFQRHKLQTQITYEMISKIGWKMKNNGKFFNSITYWEDIEITIATIFQKNKLSEESYL